MVEPKVVLAVPVLDKIPTPCFNGLASLVHAQMFSGYAVVEGTLLPFARNKLLQIVYEKNPDFTHVLFVDCDMCNFTPNHVVRLWQQDKDIISGLFTMRKAPYSVIGNFEYNTQGDVVEKYLKTQAVVETDRVGMAFTLIKKPVLDAIKENIGDGKDIWFTMDREERDGLELEIKDFIKEHKDNPPELFDKTIRDAIAFGQNAHIGTGLIGEDIAFCNRAAAMGFKFYVDFGCPVGHLADTAIGIGETVAYNNNMAAQERLAAEEKLRIVGADDA